MPLFGIDQKIVGGYSIIIQIISAMMAAFICFGTAGYFSSSHNLRKVWRLLGMGVLAWGIGAVLYSTYPLFNGGQETPYPWYSDIGYLLLYPPMLMGFIILKQHFKGKIPLYGVIVAVIVFLAAFIIAIALNVDKLSQASTITTYLVTLIYMFFDPMLLGATALIVSILGANAEARPWWVVSVGILLLYLGNLIYTYLVLIEVYVSGHFVDIAWVLGFGFFGIAALVARGTAKTKDIMH